MPPTELISVTQSPAAAAAAAVLEHSKTSKVSDKSAVGLDIMKRTSAQPQQRGKKKKKI